MKSSTSRRRTASQNVSGETLTQVDTVLRQLPEKPRDRLTLREAIAQLEASILSAFTKGYSRADVVALLNQAGVPISLPSLRYYLSSTSGNDSDSEVANIPLTTLDQPPPGKGAPKAIPSLVAALQSPRSPASRQHVEDVITYLIEE